MQTLLVAKMQAKYLPRKSYVVSVSHYTLNRSPSIEILSINGVLEMTASVCLQDPPAEGNVIIKEWSENEGIVVALAEAELIGAPVKKHIAGFGEAFEYRMKGRLLEAWNKHKKDVGI